MIEQSLEYGCTSSNRFMALTSTKQRVAYSQLHLKFLKSLAIMLEYHWLQTEAVPGDGRKVRIVHQIFFLNSNSKIYKLK